MTKIGCVQHDCEECVNTRDSLEIARRALDDRAHVLNNYEEEIVRLRGIVGTLWDALDTYGPEYMHGNAKSFYRKQFQSAIRASS